VSAGGCCRPAESYRYFADRPLSGNPAAVCPLDAWLPDATMQAIAAEMNLSETVSSPGGQGADGGSIRPLSESLVHADPRGRLIGHATLAQDFWLTRLG
jgi:hypothetical protein